MNKYLFYVGIGVDHKGRKIQEYIDQSDDWWETTHDFIQWAFPNVRPSNFNQLSPTLDKWLILFLKNPISRHYHKRLLERADEFFDFKTLSRITHRNNHNILRISRILHFCKSCNHLLPHSNRFKVRISYLFFSECISHKTYKYWSKLYHEIL